MQRIPVKLFLALTGIVLLAGLTLWAGLPSLGRAFTIFGLGGFVAVVLIHLPLIVLMGAAWWSISQTSWRARLGSFIAARLVRDSVAEVLPFSQVGGFAAGVRFLSLTAFPARAAATSLLADLLMEFFTKLFYAAAGVGLLIWLKPGSLVPSYILPMLALLAGASLLVWAFRRRLLRFAAPLFRRWAPDALEDLSPLLAVKRLMPSAALHALCWVLGGVEAWVTLRLMGIQVTALEALAIDSLATSLRTFGFWMPAALGVQEASYVLVCVAFGLSPGVAMAFSLIRRARDLLFGLAGLPVWQGLELKRAQQPASLRDLNVTSEG